MRARSLEQRALIIVHSAAVAGEESHGKYLMEEGNFG